MATGKPTICFVSTVKDEAPTIERTLLAVRPFVDHMLIVDTGSSDDTVAIAERRGATVLHCDGIGPDGLYNFSVPKQYAFEQAFATGADYVFRLDGHDVVDAAFMEELLAACAAGYEIVRAPYHTNFDAAGKPVTTVERIRACHKDSGWSWGDRRIHEVLTTKPGLRETIMVNPVLHQPAPGVGHKLDYLPLLEAERHDRPHDPRTLWHLAQEYRQRGMLDEAIATFRECYDYTAWLDEKFWSQHNIADCLRTQGKYEESIHAELFAIAVDSKWPEGRFGLGQSYYLMQDYANAVYWFARARELSEPDSIFIRDPRVYNKLDALWYLPLAYEKLGRVDEARVAAQEAIETYPDDPMAQHNAAYFAERAEHPLACPPGPKNQGRQLDTGICWIDDSTEIGEGTTYFSGVWILGGKVGRDCHIEGGAHFGCGQIIGDRVFIGPEVVMVNDRYPKAHNPDWKMLTTIIEDDVNIGANATIGPGLRIGQGATIGMGAVVTKDVPAGETWVGNPARPLRKASLTAEVVAPVYGEYLNGD